MSAPDLLWYIGTNDGEAPWDPRHRWPASFASVRAQARALEELGYYGALTTAREACYKPAKLRAKPDLKAVNNGNHRRGRAAA